MTTQSKSLKKKFDSEAGRSSKNPYAKHGKYNQVVKGRLNDLANGRGAVGIYSKIGKVAKALKGNSGKIGVGLAGLAAGTALAKVGSKVLSDRKKKANSISGRLTSIIKKQAEKL